MRYYRNLEGISQEELADRADVHRNYIARIELAQIDFSVSGLIRIAKGLKVAPEALLKES